MSATKATLPRALVRALGWVLPDHRDDVIGDLEEVHQRRVARLGRVLAIGASTMAAAWIALAFVVIWLRERDFRLQFMSKLEVLLAVRLLRKQPFLSATAMVSLAAGIAVASIGFTMIDEMLHGELPVRDGDRYVRFDVRTETGDRASFNADHFRLFKADAQTLVHVGSIDSDRRNVRHPDGGIETLVTAEITPDSLAFLDGVPLLGRQLVKADAAIGAPPVAVIRDSLWLRSYGGERSALGERVTVGDEQHEIVGVMPDAFQFPAGGELWLPLKVQSAGAEPAQSLSLFGIRNVGASMDSVHTEINTLASLVESARTGIGSKPEDRLVVDVIGFTELPGPMGIMSIVGLVVPMLVVLVIALNVANLIHARTASRRRELGLRTALGAPRSRLIGQLSLEAGVMGSVAAVLGTGAAIVSLRWIDQAITEAPFWVDLTAGPGTVLYAGFLAVLIAVTCGAVPALRATRKNLGATIAGGSSAFNVSRFGAAMMVTQMALAVALLSGALVMARSLWSAAGSDLELPDQQVLTAQIVTPAASDPNLAAAPERVALAIAQIPGVLASGTADHLPRYDAPASAIEIDGAAGAGTSVHGQATRATVSAGFLESLQARVIVGRLLTLADAEPDAARVAVVNEPFVARFFGGANPVGSRFRSMSADPNQAPEEWQEIIGVVPDLGLGGGVEQFAAGYYAPGYTERRYFYLSMLSSAEPESLVAPLRSALLELDPDLVVTRVQRLAMVNADERSFQAGFGATLSAVGGLALLLSLVGLYAMISLTITQRTREIGVRVALGASRFGIVRSVLGRAGVNLALGAVFGTGFGLAFIRLQDQQLAARLPASEPWILPVVLVAFAVAGVTACLVPALRAQRISPMEALKSE